MGAGVIVELDNGFILKCDSNSWWIERQRKSESGKERTERVSGYYARLDQLLIGFADDELSRRGKSDMKELKDGIAEIHNLIESFAPALQKAFTDVRTRRAKPRTSAHR